MARCDPAFVMPTSGDFSIVAPASEGHHWPCLHLQAPELLAIDTGDGAIR